MTESPFRFDRAELAGSLGDLGTLVPLAVALILINGLSATAVFLLIGLFYVGAGLYYRLPIPVQPLKAVSVVAIASPAIATAPVIAAAAFWVGALLLVLVATGLMDRIARLFAPPVVRGIQVGLGLILAGKGLRLMAGPEFFVEHAVALPGWANPGVGAIAVVVVLLLLSNRKYPSALVLVGGGLLVGLAAGGWPSQTPALGPSPIAPALPAWADFLTAFGLLVLPQIPLTIGNAVIGTADACRSFFPDSPSIRRTTYRSFALSMGVTNLAVGILGGMPMCHGAGGLAAHYRFGARTGGSNLMIGAFFVILALGFGKVGVAVLSLIPSAVLGTLLLFAGLELTLLIRDVTERTDLFVVLVIAALAVTFGNMGLAFGIGLVLYWLMRWRRIRI